MKRIILAALSALLCVGSHAQISNCRNLVDWQFRRDHDASAQSGWQDVRIPHDWAIAGPFDRANDLQEVAVIQNGETQATWKTGRTGGLPYMGKGCYRTHVDISLKPGRIYTLCFGGAMSEAQVLVNGTKMGEWPYGYNSFNVDITPAVNDGDNEIVVLLENREQSSRWYPGAGLYRKVTLLNSPEVHIPVWGTYVHTSSVRAQKAYVTVETMVEGLKDGDAVTVRSLLSEVSTGKVVARAEDTRIHRAGTPVVQHLTIENPSLWSPESPVLYAATTKVLTGGKVETVWGKYPERGSISTTPGNKQQDMGMTTFGVRSIEVRPGEGFFLNGERTMFKGVCLHHDLGPLGSAVNKSALRHHLLMLKDMGCNAIRTSHNMPAQELVELCDEMGLMMMLEPFDEWDAAKCDNGYHRFFADWAEKDMANMLLHYRNNPSVVMWSIGNEVPSQWAEGGLEVAAWLQDICHRLDPTRPVTCGMDQFDAVMNNGFAAQLDVPGFNYKVDRYLQALPLLPQGVILGSETASTVSSRGVYHFPVKKGYDLTTPDLQSSSYDLDFCPWSNIPDEDFAADADFPWMMGQFVWTGFDYLGEPSPYDTDAWPSHSSYFGIIDLASIPKDRFWLYRSVWNTSAPTLHVLPHWTWPGREGEVTPVYVYTSWPSAELFLNGESLGRREKTSTGFQSRFRLMWEEVKYQPGELKVLAYGADGKVVDSTVVRTAGKPYSLKMQADRTCVEADGEQLVYVTVSVVDKDGNECPTDSRLVNISVEGAGRFEAVANGDAACLENFQKPQMHLFSGKLCFIVRSESHAGTIFMKASAKGLKTAKGTILAQTELQTIDR